MEQSPIVAAIAKVANSYMKLEYPMMGNSHYSYSDVAIILKSYIAVANQMEWITEEICQKN